jgi:hypothetical protein
MVSDLNVRPKDDAMASAPEPVAQIEGLNLGTDEMPFIVPAGFRQSGPSDRSTIGPKAIRIPRALLMSEQRHHVPVPRDQAEPHRVSIVGPIHRRHLGVLGKELGEGPERGAPDADIGIDEQNDLAGSELDSSVSGVGGAVGARPKAHHDISPLRCELGG